MFVLSQLVLLSILDSLKTAVFAAGAGLVHVHLAKGPFNPTLLSDPTTFTEADYTGYVSQTVPAWSTSVMAGGSAETISTTVLTFSPTGILVLNTVTGYWLVNASGEYLGGEVLNPAVPLSGPTSALDIVLKWQENSSDWSGVVIP
jgi:hypothetical protein